MGGHIQHAAYLNLYHALAEEAMQAHQALWQITPKFHYYCHVLDQIRSSAFNPRWSHCVVYESFYGLHHPNHWSDLRSGLDAPGHAQVYHFLSIRWQHHRDTLV